MQLLSDPSRKKLVYSYGFDWVLVVIMTVVFFAIDQITPFHRMFSVEDKTIMFPYTENESVPVWLLLVICFVAPIAIIAIVSLGGVGYKRRSYYDFHSGVLGLCLGLSMTIMLTDVIKITAGRPRPDMLSRCQPPADTRDPLFGLTSVDVCTTAIDSHIMIDGFKSFPSGHSSFSFAGLGFLAFYLAGKMKMFDERGHTYKGFMFAFPIIGAMLVAISRTRDYRHHWQDVTVGAILGTLCAYFAYRQYYPGLSHANCYDPFLARMDGCHFSYLEEDEEANVDDSSNVGLLNSSHSGYHSQGSSRYQLDGELNNNNNNNNNSNSNKVLAGRRNL